MGNADPENPHSPGRGPMPSQSPGPQGAKRNDYIADRGYTAAPVYLTDLDRRVPAGTSSPTAKRRKWRSLEYEADALAGTTLLAGPETEAPEITLGVGVSGWHAISFGIFEGHGILREPLKLLSRLSGDSTFSILTWQPDDTTGARIVELFWRVADLTGQELVLGQMGVRATEGDGPGSVQCYNAGVAYVKLTPLDEQEVDALVADRERADTRRLWAHNDAWSMHYAYRQTSVEEIRRQIEPFRDSDFARILWEVGGGDSLLYSTKIARLQTHDDLDDFARPGERWAAESLRLLQNSGIDPFEVAIAHAHALGMEFHAGYRVANFYSPPPQDYGRHDSFYHSHPELRGVDRDGNRTPRIAYSYPETRKYVLSLLEEIATYPVDGICIMYNRRPPIVEYEPPLVDGFIARFGEDPRQLDSRDSRWLSYRAEVLTGFMREVRRAMDGVAERHNRPRRIEVSAIVSGDEQENLLFGLDLKAWVDEGLVDTLIGYSSIPRFDAATAGRSESWKKIDDVDYLVSLTRGTACRLAINIMPRRMSPEAYRLKAAALYGAGVEDLFLWDSDAGNRADFGEAFSALRRLGHREEVAAWVASSQSSLRVPGMDVRRLGDFDVSYEVPE